MEKAILQTLVYADIFAYPLKKEEIWQWLIDGNQESGIRNQEKEFEKVLKKLLEAGRCQKTSGYYFLPGRKKIVKFRERREKASSPKIKKAKKTAQVLKLIPWVKFIGITGGLARKNSEKGDDIDLFFITAKNRLWLTRGLVVLLLTLLGCYRRPKKIKDMICPNMLVSEEALKIFPQDLFTAHEVALMRPVFDRDGTYQKFLKANLWAREFLPNARGWRREKGSAMQNGEGRKRKKKIINSVERLAKRAQLWYMRKKKTTEIVSSSLIKFHPEDVRGRILIEYKKRLREVHLS